TTTTTRPDGLALSATYDSAGRRTAITQPRGSSTYAYDAAGRLNRLSSPDGITLSVSYDGALLTGLAWSGPVVGSINATYDNNFRMTADNVNGANGATYAYDNDGLVTQAGALAVTHNAQNGLLTGTTLGNL